MRSLISAVLRPFSSLHRSRLIRRWPLTILPALLIVFTLLFINWRLRSSFAPEEPFSTFALPYYQNFDDVPVNRWFMSGGKWLVDGGTLAQTDNSANLAKIFVPKWLAEGEPYQLAVELTLSESTKAAGVNFNAQYPEIQRDHERVYISREGEKLELLAGVADEAGGFQASARVAVPSAADTFKLDLLVHGTTYDVLIDDEPLLQNRPLTYFDGLVGLFAINGPTEFDDLSIEVLDDSFTLELSTVEPELATAVDVDEGQSLYASDFSEGMASGWVPFSGDWRVEEGRLTQFDASGFDFGIGYEGQTFQSYSVQTAFNHLSGTGGGLLFNMASPSQLKDAHVVRYSDRSDSVVYGYFDENGVYNTQGYSSVSAPAADEHTFKVVSGESSYDLYVDNQLIASAIPLVRNNGYIGLLTAKSTAAYSLIDVTASLSDPNANNSEAAVVLAEPAVATAEPVAAAAEPVAATAKPAAVAAEPTAVTTNISESSPNSAPGVAVVSGQTRSVETAAETTAETTASDSELSAVGLDGWVTISGQWGSSEEGNIIQAEKDGFDLATGFASETFSAVDLEVTIEHLDGVGAGLLFNMPAADALQGAHMVRYADWTDAIVWGYFDELGQFNGQGYAKIEPPAASAHRLRVVSGEGSYAVYLDGEQLAVDLPLFSESGHIGLITSKAEASFGSIRAASNGQPSASFTALASSNDFFGDIETISGEWLQEGTKLSQINEATYDFSISTGVYAGLYTLETEIALPDDPDLQDAGGGVLFHMPERSSRTGAHMVRFTGQDSLLWGYYDQDGIFVGQGREQLDVTGALNHKLRVAVDKDSYRIMVDDQEVALNVPLKQQEGWIGLVSYRGPVAFDGVSVTFGTEE
jgi:hypothetical protein